MMASLSSSRLSGSVSSLLISLNLLLLALPWDIRKLMAYFAVLWLAYFLLSFGSPTPTKSGSESLPAGFCRLFNCLVISAVGSSPVTVVFLRLCISLLLLNSN